MKHLHTIRCREQARLNISRQGAGRIELKTGAMIVSAPPRKTEAIAEKPVEGFHGGEAREMNSDYGDATAADVEEHFVEHFLVFGSG